MVLSIRTDDAASEEPKSPRSRQLHHDRLELAPLSSARSSDPTTPSNAYAESPNTPQPVPPPANTMVYQPPTRVPRTVRPLNASARRRAIERKTAAKYGELVVVGYNGFMHPMDRGRRRSKFELYQRPTPNGIKRSRHYAVTSPESAPAISDPQKYAMSYELPSSQYLIVEYTADKDKDMFQLGRSSEKSIDFVVLNTLPGDKAPARRLRRSTISKFPCRIVADRLNPKIVKVYAGAFNGSGNMFLGARATKWQYGGQIDGLTNTGVLIRHPKHPYTAEESDIPEDPNNPKGLWREVSISGQVLTLRGFRSAQEKGLHIADETNVLQDGTLIDLCGVTLLWRSAEGLANSPTVECIERMLNMVNADRPRCPFGLNTLIVPRSNTYHGKTEQAHVYLDCGHVLGHDWPKSVSGVRKCPSCSTVGPVVLLCMGVEPSLYADIGKPTHAFIPCGHMTTLKTAKFWARMGTPHGTVGFDSVCPFCYIRIEGHPGYVELIFHDDDD